MAAQVFWAVFHSSQQQSQISTKVDFDSAAISPPIFSMVEPQTNHIKWNNNLFHFDLKEEIIDLLEI